MSDVQAREPVINATIRACVDAALAKGLPPSAVRASTIARFVDAFAESAEANEFVKDYRKQVTAVVDQAIKDRGA